jgi:hypothetical protein
MAPTIMRTGNNSSTPALAPTRTGGETGRTGDGDTEADDGDGDDDMEDTGVVDIVDFVVALSCLL